MLLKKKLSFHRMFHICCLSSFFSPGGHLFPRRMANSSVLKTDTLASLGIEIIFAHHDSSACGLHHRVWEKYSTEAFMLTNQLTPNNKVQFCGISKAWEFTRSPWTALPWWMMSSHVTSCRQTASSVQFTTAVVFSLPHWAVSAQQRAVFLPVGCATTFRQQT